jgi:hypothetical protein
MRRIQNKTAGAERKAGNMADGHETGSTGAEAEYRKGGRSAGHIFILRLWEEQEGSGAWAGRVQHVLRGDARSFADLKSLTECLVAMLPSHASDHPVRPGTTSTPPEPPYATKSQLEEKGENEC